MNPDDIERQLQDRIMRPIPAEWRQSILSAAQVERANRIAEECPASRPWIARHAGWAALAAIWVIIAGIHVFNTVEVPAVRMSRTASVEDWAMHWREERRILAELSEPHPVQPVLPDVDPRLPKSGSRLRAARTYFSV